MRLAFGQNCSCGAPIVARTIKPEPVTFHGKCALDVQETCSVGHVANFSVGSVTMEELASAHITDTKGEA